MSKSSCGIRQKVFEILEFGISNNKLSAVVNMSLAILIGLNVLAVILGSVTEFYVRFSSVYNFVEIFSVTVFTIEYLLRLWTAPLKVSPDKNHKITPYWRSFFGITDLAAILPFFISLVIPFVSVDLRILRILRICRFLRILKLPGFGNAMDVIVEVLKKQKAKLYMTVIFFVMMIFLASSLMYLFEDVFPDILTAIWWAVGSLTTVGYGYDPVTIPGRVLGAIISILGIGLIAMPTGIISIGFVDAANSVCNPPSEKDDTEVKPIDLSNVGSLGHFYNMLELAIKAVNKTSSTIVLQEFTRKSAITSKGFGKHLYYEARFAEYVYFWIGVRFHSERLHIYIKYGDEGSCPKHETKILKELKPGEYFGEIEDNDVSVWVPLKDEHYAKLCGSDDAEKQKEIIQKFLEEVLGKLKV